MQKENSSEKLEIAVILNVEDAIKYIHDKGYLLLGELDLDRDELSKRIREEGFESHYGLIYNPKTIEMKTVNSEKDDLGKYKGEGWEEVGKRNAEYATLIKKIEQKQEE